MNVRQMMKDPRAAAVIGILAIGFSGYRVYTMMNKTGPTAEAPAASSDDTGGLPADNAAIFDNSTPGAQDVAVVASDVAWGWERNPFTGGKDGPPKRIEDAGSSTDPKTAEINTAVPSAYISATTTPAAGTASAATPSPAVPPASTGPVAKPAAPEAPTELRGIVMSDGRGVAIIGDKVVRQGQAVDGWLVESVERYRVVLRNGNETRVLELSQPPAKAAAKTVSEETK